MPRLFIHFTFLFFMLTALSGVWMRFALLKPNNLIPYTNVLHGHSHLAILGWSFIGAFIVFLSIFWRTIIHKKQAHMLTFTLSITSIIMFGAFLYQGYGVFSIAMATIHIFLEYWAAIFIYRQLKTEQAIPQAGKLFINAALIALVISSIGPFLLGYISAKGLKESYLFDMAMYFYLHFQYNGWLTLFLIGVFICILHIKKVPVQNSLLNQGFWLYFISLFPSYFTNVLWIDLGGYSEVLAAIGGIGQWLGILFVLAAFKRMWQEIGRCYAKITLTCLWLTLVLLLFKSTMELGLISPMIANLIYGTRSVVIGYLHLTLLGFVSIFIVAQYLMIGIIHPKKSTIYGLAIFFAGFFLNELLLFSQALMQWLNLSAISLYTEGLLLASSLLFIGIITVWVSYLFTVESSS